MSEKPREVPKLADATYAHNLVIESTHEYKVHGPYGSNFPFMSTFNDQITNIDWFGKLGHLSGFLRHYLLTILYNIARIKSNILEKDSCIRSILTYPAAMHKFLLPNYLPV